MKRIEFKKKFIGIILFIFPFIISYVMMELLDRNTHFLLGFKRILFNFIVIIVLNLFIYSITNKIKPTLIISNSILLILGIINYFVLSFRGTPLVPWDFLSFGTAATIAGNYTFNITYYLILPIFLFVLLIFILAKIHHKFELIKLNIASRSAILVFIFIFIVAFYRTDLINFFGLETNLWEPTNEYHSNGFLASFLKQSKNLVNPPPNNYSVDQVKKIANEFMSEETNTVATVSMDKKSPNIIVVQNESFADLSILR